jgi:large exoprotein involved in heme utilization and adhesion
MISFKQYLAEELLDEGFVRSATLLVLAQRAKSSGDKAVSSFQAGKRILAAGTATDTSDDAQKRTQSALALLFDGLMDLRSQMGSVAALSLTGHLLSAQNSQTLLSRKK